MSMIQIMLSLLEKAVSRCKPVYVFLKKSKVSAQRVRYAWLNRTGREHRLVYNRSFFDKNLETNVPIAKAMAKILTENFHPGSVADVGCGNAEFLYEFLLQGITIKGYDASPYAFEKARVAREFLELFDLRKSIMPSMKYDLALCFEVAEHIENKFSGKLVENLASLSDTILFTAAPPGQGGHFHINEQPREFWVAIFKQGGFGFDAVTTQRLKDEMREKDILWWYYQNLMVFKRLNARV